ncbi:MAG: alpha/beta hydrolase fold domain-containing protein, partial [Coprococcus sp.]
MSSQNNLTIKTERIKDIMLDDKHMRAGDIQKSLLKGRRKEDYNPPTANTEKLDIKSVFEKGGVCFYIKPKNKEVNKYFFYLHGGGYCRQINSRQWNFVFDMVEKTGYGAAVPIYPLAPEHSAADVFDMLMGAYTKICHNESVERIVLVGEEAGAGLALSMALLAWNGGYRRPNKLVLISPVMDTEFLDKDLEKSLQDRKRYSYRYYYTPEVKAFLKIFWVKDMAGKVEYTSPIYADLTDICDEMAIFTVSDDLMNIYARKLYEKVKKLQIRIHYYEFYSIIHNFIEHPHIPECRMIIGKIRESITNENQTVSKDIIRAVWARSFLAQRYSKIFSDIESIKLAEKLGIQHKAISAEYNTYGKAVMMERIVAIDERVRQFIRRYADGIVVNVGAELNTMFSRVDNGRIKWYNVDLPERIELRRKYLDSRDREKNIDKSIFDYSWMEQIRREQNQAILFVCCDLMKYFDKNKLKGFLNAIWNKFPGAEIVFDIKNSKGKKLWNRIIRKGKSKGSSMRISIDNCTSLLYDWNIKYKILFYIFLKISSYHLIYI